MLISVGRELFTPPPLPSDQNSITHSPLLPSTSHIDDVLNGHLSANRAKPSPIVNHNDTPNRSKKKSQLFLQHPDDTPPFTPPSGPLPNLRSREGLNTFGSSASISSAIQALPSTFPSSGSIPLLPTLLPKTPKIDSPAISAIGSPPKTSTSPAQEFMDVNTVDNESFGRPVLLMTPVLDDSTRMEVSPDLKKAISTLPLGLSRGGLLLDYGSSDDSAESLPTLSAADASMDHTSDSASTVVLRVKGHAFYYDRAEILKKSPRLERLLCSKTPVDQDNDTAFRTLHSNEIEALGVGIDDYMHLHSAIEDDAYLRFVMPC